MNAPLPPDAVAVASLPVAEIVPSPSNPRKHFDEDYIAELADSIKAHGLIQPITVRPLPLDAVFAYNKGRKKGDDSHPRYEIVVGECRWRAAKLAGLAEIPGFWRELDDKQVLEIQVIENLQRRDVHPIEEAEGYDQLIGRHGYTADTLGEKIGKSRSYVYGRLKLLALDKPAREACFKSQLDASTALLIARVPHSLQKKALDNVLNGYGGEPLSYRSAKDMLARNFTVSLQHATFPLGDAELVPVAGACSACPKRAGNDLVLQADGVDADVCTDTKCFEEKRLARRQQLIAHAERKGIQVYTGEASREFAPGGIHSLDPDKYVSLDARVPGDGQERSYREILGDKAAVIAITEQPWGDHDLIELGEPTALARALKKAGWKPADDREDEVPRKAAQAEKRRRDEELEARAQVKEAEEEWRTGLRDKVVAALRANSPAGEPQLRLAIRLIGEAWLRMTAAYNGLDEVEHLFEHHGITLPEEFDEQEELARIAQAMDAWSPGEILALLAADMTGEEVRVPWDFDPAKDQPRMLLALGAFADLAEEDLRRPGEVQPAAADSGEDYLQIGDRVRVKDDARGPTGKHRKCCGREGTVEDIRGGGANLTSFFSVRFGSKAHDFVANLSRAELEKLPPADLPPYSGGAEPAPPPSQAAQAQGVSATEPAAPAKPKGKRKAAAKSEEKPDPAPAAPANEPAAPVEQPFARTPWPFPTGSRPASARASE